MMQASTQPIIQSYLELSPEERFYVIKNHATQGDPYYCYELGKLYESGFQGESDWYQPNLVHAAYWYNKALIMARNKQQEASQEAIPQKKFNPFSFLTSPVKAKPPQVPEKQKACLEKIENEAYLSIERLAKENVGDAKFFIAMQAKEEKLPKDSYYREQSFEALLYEAIDANSQRGLLHISSNAFNGKPKLDKKEYLEKAYEIAKNSIPTILRNYTIRNNEPQAAAAILANNFLFEMYGIHALYCYRNTNTDEGNLYLQRAILYGSKLAKKWWEKSVAQSKPFKKFQDKHVRKLDNEMKLWFIKTAEGFFFDDGFPITLKNWDQIKKLVFLEAWNDEKGVFIIEEMRRILETNKLSDNQKSNYLKFLSKLLLENNPIEPCNQLIIQLLRGVADDDEFVLNLVEDACNQYTIKLESGIEQILSVIDDYLFWKNKNGINIFPELKKTIHNHSHDQHALKHKIQILAKDAQSKLNEKSDPHLKLFIEWILSEDEFIYTSLVHAMHEDMRMRAETRPPVSSPTLFGQKKWAYDIGHESTPAKSESKDPTDQFFSL